MYVFSENLESELERAVKKEENAGIQKWGSINSPMEAYAILKGEIEEIDTELQIAIDLHESAMWPNVHKNNKEDAGKAVLEIRRRMFYVIQEAIQVAGVCDSYLNRFCPNLKK